LRLAQCLVQLSEQSVASQKVVNALPVADEVRLPYFHFSHELTPLDTKRH
jgi:hypothetical protein